MTSVFKKKGISSELFFILSMLVFGVFSTFLTFPLTNGDEGYHLSKSYTLFSKDMPKSMRIESLRAIESKNTEPEQGNNDFNLKTFFSHKLADVEQDGFTFKQKNIISNIKYLPSSVGVLVARCIYPSYGVILIFARISSLIFFSVCLYFIIKYSNTGKWSLVMLFSVPFIQKIASPSYDVFSYVAIAAFATNVLRLAKLDKFSDLSLKKCLYTLLTIFLILLSKANYIFILPTLLILPMFTTPIRNLYISYIKPKKIKKIFFWTIIALSMLLFIFLLNSKLGIGNFSKQFFNSYFNIATMGRRAESLFNVVPTILPDFFNIIWILCLFFVILTEQGYDWGKLFVTGNIACFLLNWVGIYTGFYLILGKPDFPFDELSGRYLHPFIICFLPLTQLINYKYKLTVPSKTIRLIAIVGTMTILISYLGICYYRGFVIHTTPTWKP